MIGVKCVALRSAETFSLISQEVPLEFKGLWNAIYAGVRFGNISGELHTSGVPLGAFWKAALSNLMESDDETEWFKKSAMRRELFNLLLSYRRPVRHEADPIVQGKCRTGLDLLEGRYPKSNVQLLAKASIVGLLDEEQEVKVPWPKFGFVYLPSTGMSGALADILGQDLRVEVDLELSQGPVGGGLGPTGKYISDVTVYTMKVLKLKYSTTGMMNKWNNLVGVGHVPLRVQLVAAPRSFVGSMGNAKK